MTVPIYREGDEVEVTRRGVIVITDPKDPARYGIGKPGVYGADSYFRTDDGTVTHRLVSPAEPASRDDEFSSAVRILREAADLARRSPPSEDRLIRDLADPVADWLESWHLVEVREDGPMPEDLRFARRIVRAINGGGRG